MPVFPADESGLGRIAEITLLLFVVFQRRGADSGNQASFIVSTAPSPELSRAWRTRRRIRQNRPPLGTETQAPPPPLQTRPTPSFRGRERRFRQRRRWCSGWTEWIMAAQPSSVVCLHSKRANPRQPFPRRRPPGVPYVPGRTCRSYSHSSVRVRVPLAASSR